MKRLSIVWLSCVSLFAGVLLLPGSAAADSGHARIVRLSLVQGDIRYTRQFHKDSMDDSKAVWEPAPLNLPIREGYAVATDANSRAEVEFENGAMAFLSGNTVLEFYDLSLDDGALITRLVLRQGSAIFYVNPAKDDFFSVTGGDFSIEANNRSRFRLDNYDDGSTVNVEQGRVSVLRKNETKALEKGQSYSINVNDGQAPIVGRAADYDEFDKWVSGRIDSVVTATTYNEQYVNSSSSTPGYADLYSYGGWYDMPGYGYGWQPYGVGLGWNPFAFGSWNYDSFFGWNFIGSAPWGWLPYHYGGWVFSPTLGWLWVPTAFGFGGPAYYRPVTAVWVHNNGVTGLVPSHPADVHGKPPMNLGQGVYTVRGNIIAPNVAPSTGEKWAVMSHPARDTFTTTAAEPTPAPVRVSRTILSGNSGSRAVTVSRDSSIVYDPAQHRFVNNGNPSRTTEETVKSEGGVNPAGAGNTTTSAAVNGRGAKPNSPAVPHPTAPRPNVTPPTPPASAHSSHPSGGAIWNAPGSTTPSNSTSSTHTSSGTSSHSSSHH